MFTKTETCSRVSGGLGRKQKAQGQRHNTFMLHLESRSRKNTLLHCAALQRKRSSLLRPPTCLSSTDLIKSSSGALPLPAASTRESKIKNSRHNTSLSHKLLRKQYASSSSPAEICGRNLLLRCQSSSSSSSSSSPQNGSSGKSSGGLKKKAGKGKQHQKAQFQLCRTDGFTCETQSEHVDGDTFVKFAGPSTHCHMLVWKTCPKTVLVLKKRGSALIPHLRQVARYLWFELNMRVVVEPEVGSEIESMPELRFVETFAEDEVSSLYEYVDFVVCLGGDGVVLHASNLFRKAMPPVISFNLGSLGFLTNHKHEDYKLDLSNMTNSCYPTPLSGVFVTLRMRLSVKLLRGGVPVPGKEYEVLNEVCVDRGSNSYLCMIECYERNRLITKVQGDGVLLSTPTGSTAYSVAAGGSIVHPSVPAILFTPICPHSLSFRPVLLPDSAELELKVPIGARGTAWVSFDGKDREELHQGDSIMVSMSEYPMPSINKTDETDDWFKSLVRCLRWNERLDQVPFESNNSKKLYMSGTEDFW